jgi:lipid-binding SYLF domain-containing protein
MKKATVMICALAMTAGTVVAQAQDSKLNDRLDAATAVIQEVMSTPDKAIPQSILAGASCVVVVPSFKKAAFVVGGQYGQGVATCRTPRGWSAPVFVQLTGGSFGFQIGGQATDLVLVAMNQHGLQDMLKNKFKIGGDAAASAGPVDLDGTVLSQNTDDTRTEYGTNVSYNTVLKGDVPTPDGAKQFVHTVARYFVVSKDAQ